MHIKYYWQEKGFQVVCLTTTRKGGVSKAPYDELNMSYKVGDSQEDVTINRQYLCKQIGITLDCLVLGKQVHGTDISVVTEADAGRGARDFDSAIPSTDALITISTSVAIGVLTADCVPVMIYDPVKHSAGIAHAGWKGTLNKIAAKTVLKMQEIFGSDPKDCFVALGPCIGPCCYNVEKSLTEAFRETFGDEVRESNETLDLAKAVEIQLLSIGVKRERIYSENICTSCHRELFYSHRAENGTTGRMMSLIKLKPIHQI